MEALTRNPFTDERLKELIISKFTDSTSATGFREVRFRSLNLALEIIESLDPYANPVTKHEFRAWLLDNGFQESTHPKYENVKCYKSNDGDKEVIDFDDDDYSIEIRSKIQSHAETSNISPFTLYGEIKLKYGTNNK